MSISGAEATVAALLAADIRVVFGLPGVHNLPIWQAIARTPIRLIGVRHEQSAVYAADGLARRTGTVAVALTTTGPGAANAVAATGEAMASGSPVVVVATDIPRALRRPGVNRGVLHEIREQSQLFGAVTKEQIVVDDADAIAASLRSALQAAARPPAGPVYLEIPTDFLTRDSADTEPAEPHKPPPATGSLTAAVLLIAANGRPLIWAGGGALGAAESVRALARRLRAPVIETFAARGLMPLDDPWRVPATPHYPPVGALWDEADLVISVGTQFDGMMTQNWRMPQPRRHVAINIDATDAAKNYDADVALIGDASYWTAGLLTASPERESDGWAPRLTHLQRDLDAFVERDEPAAARLLRTLADPAISACPVVADMCIPGYWAAGLHRAPAPRMLAYPVGWGTLGFALPAALGAAVAGRTICLTGDGGAMFALGELATIVEASVPLTVVLFDDGGYGMLRYDQDEKGWDRLGVDLHTPDFMALASAFGLPASAVGDVGEELRAAILGSLDRDGPSVVIVRGVTLKPPVSTSPRWYRSS